MQCGVMPGKSFKVFLHNATAVSQEERPIKSVLYKCAGVFILFFKADIYSLGYNGQKNKNTFEIGSQWNSQEYSQGRCCRRNHFILPWQVIKSAKFQMSSPITKVFLFWSKTEWQFLKTISWYSSVNITGGSCTTNKKKSKQIQKLLKGLYLGLCN